MPYVFYETLPEGAEEAHAVSQEEYDRLCCENEGLVTTNADLASQVDKLGRDLRESKKKYADAFTTANRVVNKHAADTKKDSGPHSFGELFAKRTGDGNAR